VNFEVAGSKLVSADCVSIFLLELMDGCEVGFDDLVLDGVKILWSLFFFFFFRAL
jgi:hypothetical protein